MGLTQDEFLLLNGALVTLIALSYLWIRRKPRGPVRLDFSKKFNNQTTISSSERRARFEQALEDCGPLPVMKKGHIVKELNVIFNYNGHAWDAYEVLGLPAGSSLERAHEAYIRVYSEVDRDSREFIDAAYQAILKSTA